MILHTSVWSVNNLSANVRCLELLPLLVIPESTLQEVPIGLIVGLLQSDGTWLIGYLVFLVMMPEYEGRPHAAGYELLLPYGKN
jgi:hypothetical protein